MSAEIRYFRLMVAGERLSRTALTGEISALRNGEDTRSCFALAAPGTTNERKAGHKLRQSFDSLATPNFEEVHERTCFVYDFRLVLKKKARNEMNTELEKIPTEQKQAGPVVCCGESAPVLLSLLV